MRLSNQPPSFAQPFTRMLAGLILGLGLWQTCLAESPLPSKMNFQHLLENKDITLGEVQAFYQDKQGFMWIGGGGGLIRYDGYNFTFIQETTQSGQKKNLGVVNGIYQDKEGLIWVSTRTGLYYYTPATERITPISDNPKDSLPISTTGTFEVTELTSGEILAPSTLGLFVVDKKTMTYTSITAKADTPNSLQGTRVPTVYQEPNGPLWVGSDQGLHKVDWASKTFTLIKPYADHPEEMAANSVTDIEPDRNGGLWLATYDGLIHYTPSTGKTLRYTPDPKNPNSIGGKDIATVMVDTTGVVWVASDGGGVSVFEKTPAYPEGRFTNHLAEAGRPGALNTSQVRVVYQDRIGDIWVGNYPSGINYFDRTSAAITSYAQEPNNPNSLPHSAILDIREDPQGNLWLGTDGGGLTYFNRSQNTFTHYKNDPNNPQSLGANAVLCQYLDADGTLWAGTWGGGVTQINPSTGRIQRLPFDLLSQKTEAISQSNRLNNAHVWSIKADKQNNLWMATHAGGLSKYDRKSQTYTHYSHINSDPNSISSGIIWDVLEDSKGRFWVGTGSGIDLLDRTTGQFTHFKPNPSDPKALSNPSVLILFEDSQKRLWFGTESGLNLLNPDNKTFTVYNERNGMNNAYIRAIVEDPKGQLWISTNNGISLLNPTTQSIKNYNRINGRLMGAFHTDAGIFSKKGEIIFGGVEGLRIFDIQNLQENTTAPPLAFTGLKIFADTQAVGENNFLKQSLNTQPNITFNYTQSMFQVEFAALNFRDSNKNQYAYKLEGFDKDWLQVGDQRSAKYTNLSPGHYTFKIKGSNNDGVWNEQGIALKIEQLPPPWKTWWAYTLYTLAALAALFGFIKQQQAKRRAVEEQNRQLEIKVSERTAELRSKNKDIQAMLENMPQGLFTIQPDETIHPEYSRALESIFDTTQIAGITAHQLLFQKANLGSDTHSAAVNAINAIIGESEMNFSFNQPLLVQEYSLDINTRKKYLALDWNPIIEDDTVTKLMVSVRDITQLKEMETQSLAQKRELDIISQLIKMSTEKMLGFEESALRYLHLNHEAIENTPQRNEDTLGLLFRNMHTIKGNCRTYGFSHLSDVVHEVESVYTALRNNPELEWNPHQLLNDLSCVHNALAEYTHIFKDVLGRGERDNSAHDGVWLSHAEIEKIEDYSTQGDLPGLQSYLGAIQSKPLTDVLVDVVASLSSIAGQLGKPTPVVRFDTAKIRIKNTRFEFMCDIFAHLLRNSVDHGIETAEERLRNGKAAQGEISVRALPVLNHLNIFISDDGRGLDLERLVKKGVERGAWPKQNPPNKQDIADLVFCSGISTKDTITDISGRGVGLDAVKKFVQAQGGNIQIVLNDVQNAPLGFTPFELVIQLPNSVFLEANN